MTLELTLLGRPQIKLNGHPAPLVSANKALALLYYLAATGHVHSRQALAGLLWSDLPEDAARRNLRVELNRLREFFDPYLLSSRETLAFNKALDYQIDLAVFEACLRHPNPTTQQMQAAIDLYQGEFLEDFHIRDAALFEEWQFTERERLRQAVQRLTLRLVQQYTHARQYDAAITCGRRLLAREPWLEEGHQQLMLLCARTGQRGSALAQYELCTQAIEDEFGVLPSEETNQLYDRILSGEIGPDIANGLSLAPAGVLAPAPVAAPPFQAPPMLLHFVGRDEELSVFSAWVAQGAGAAVYGLVGMGGVGKSTLATHIAHTLRDRFPDGVLWAHVATSDPLDILSNWARAFGYDFSSLPDVENRAAALRGVLAEKTVLLVLDDVQSVARTKPLLLGGAHCTTLLTTRNLDVAAALNAQIFRLGELAPEAGLRLLTRILGEPRVSAELDAAQAICAALQHLPLAVEITAQRLASRPRRRLVDMAERLHRVEERLDLSISDRAVRTSFMVSWESLDANLRKVFALLGVFKGRSFSAPALAHIAGLDLYTSEDRLFALTALSLVGEEDENRYRQHPLLSDFAGEQLGENTLPLVDMSLYYQQFAEQNRSNYLALRPEWENLMAGMATAHRLGQWPLVQAYAETLAQAWFVRARYAQAREGLAWARDAAQAMNDLPALAVALLRWGQACIEQNDYAEAKVILAECLQVYEQLDHAAGIADVQYYLGRVAIEEGELDKAEQLLVASQQRREQLGDAAGVAATLYQQAFLWYRRSEFAQSKTLCERALQTQEGISDEAGLVPSLRLLADIALEHQDYHAADSYLKRALVLCNILQDRGELAATYYGLAVVARHQDELELAHEYVRNALELSQWMGNRQFQAVALYEQIWLYAKQDDHTEALKAGRKSLELFRALQDGFNLVYILCHLGKYHAEIAQNHEARQLWQEALPIAEQHNHPLLDQLRQYLNG
jgi:DNA-binding SARP family transcriptional activator